MRICKHNILFIRYLKRFKSKHNQINKIFEYKIFKKIFKINIIIQHKYNEIAHRKKKQKTCVKINYSK